MDMRETTLGTLYLLVLTNGYEGDNIRNAVSASVKIDMREATLGTLYLLVLTNGKKLR